MLLINLPKKNHFILSGLLIIFIILFVLILSGCAKTGYPQAPTVQPPYAPHIISIKKKADSLTVIYKYKFNTGNIKEFLIYEKSFKKKTKKNLSCSQVKLAAIQNLKFAKKFKLNETGNRSMNIFFYKINKSALKRGYYYIFCVKSKNYFDISSSFSNFLALHIN
ncbi:MAG: hypothetical protein EVJ46_04710 [Candidatus Acididesulfobacter guangdongensis]|uniref:Uncharacterized protein n=1 Tax=Acididesulfobacter guangdongensis TaxID=2597225 RepID=A0A519BGE2_ACIG2|nr:MAG: hypothetical protein EVJ46_04710 [Candidatus Acididesulfobacter guangdongensis]